MECPKVCAVCMSSPVFPIQLSCEHIFCYLCVKGVVNNDNTSKCPSIDANVLKHPKFVANGVNSCDRPVGAFDTIQWFYEGRKGTGFWAYDHSNAVILEEAFINDQKMCEITISGVIYCVDFVRQIQYQKYQTSRKRSIRRDLLSNIESAKGIAGVSKYLVRNIFTGNQSKSSDGAHTSAQNSAKNVNKHSLDNSAEESESEEPIHKKVKVEVKVEPDSTNNT
ncbi:unnamed protein product [Medioppia subpectinata]|uniref:E3 ubiquitin-protein ligase n=1 Tax=Medioppia subpectinata TaxID=1979941 RepID=A0A7R9Q2E9_9ACAR|nr:unnamed protein product [Medioppia subpectinata]CAG2110201.1 unnamed protein product [Medioppia subpectinata]